MKIMAIGTLKPLTPEQQRTYMPDEVPATLKLYLDGKMEQFWLREANAGVIFLMTVDSIAEADALLKAMPLGHANSSDVRANARWAAHPTRDAHQITSTNTIRRATSPDESGAITGGVAGAVGGAVLGGPVGAVVGGVGGAAIGNSMTNHRHYHRGYPYHPYHHYDQY